MQEVYYQTYLVPLGNLPSYGFRASEHLLRKAFEWFEKKVADYLRKVSGDKGVALAQLVEATGDRLFFTVITVTDELTAYKIYETLNERGVRPSSTDLLKNYLFSVLHREDQNEHEMKVLEDRWESVVERLGSESFPDFLRFYWLSRQSFVRQSELFKTIRSQINNRQHVFLLLQGMEQDVDTYLALSKPEGSEWTRECKQAANTLRLFSVKQPYSLIMAARRTFSDADFAALLRACVTISFRYNVIGNQPTNEQERVYYSAAQKISQGEITTLRDVLPLMISIYPSDKAFRADFAEKSIKTVSTRNTRIVRYILCALEKHIGGTDLDFDSEKFNIEHILPQNPNTGWENFSENEAEALAYRLGNMMLLETSANRNLGNATYDVKKLKYQTSAFCQTQKVAEENAEWSGERIAARQEWMANQAKSVWSIAQLA